MDGALELELLGDELAIVRLDPDQEQPAWAEGPSALTAVVRTAEELSLVVPAAAVPEDLERVGPWRAFKVQGPLDFALTGILAGLAGTLAGAEISLFAISTYDTDYLLVRAEDAEDAASALRRAGHRVLGGAKGLLR
jgi:hypothetical protein